MMKPKRFFSMAAAAALLSLSLVFSLNQCKSLQLQQYAPDVKLVDVKLGTVDFSGASVDFIYEMHNKINFSLTFSKLMFRIFVDGKMLIEADNPKNIELAANGTTQFTITQRIIFKDFAESLIDLFKKDQITAKLEGKVGIVLLHINQNLEVPINGEKVIPIPKLPSIKFSKFEYVSASLNPFDPKATFALKFNVSNSNGFPVNLSALKYSFNAASRSIVDGDAGKMAIPAGQEKQLSIPVNLKGKDIIELVPKLRDLNSTSFSFASELGFDAGGQEVKVPYKYP